MESKTFCRFLISYMVPTMVGVRIYQILSIFFAKFHYFGFWVTSYTRGGCPLKELFLKTSAMESKTFYEFLISYMVPIMVGVWVNQIDRLFWRNSIILDFGRLAIPGVAAY